MSRWIFIRFWLFSFQFTTTILQYITGYSWQQELPRPATVVAASAEWTAVECWRWLTLDKLGMVSLATLAAATEHSCILITGQGSCCCWSFPFATSAPHHILMHMHFCIYTYICICITNTNKYMSQCGWRNHYINLWLKTKDTARLDS